MRMFNFRPIRIYNPSHCLCTSSTVFRQNSDETFHRFRRVVVLGKLTKYEKLGEHLKSATTKEGVNVNWLYLRHSVHHENMAKLHQMLKLRDLDVHLVRKEEYDADVIEWADCVITAGGDGTFLLGASGILNRDKPILGINTDPAYSEGYLCLPKWRTFDLARTVDLFLKGNYIKFWRNRIRVNVYKQLFADASGNPSPGAVGQHLESAIASQLPLDDAGLLSDDRRMQCQRLPTYALNDLFIGEAENARVSQYTISIDGKSAERQKSSGLVISTGTGSSAWYQQIRRISQTDVLELLTLASCLSTASTSSAASSHSRQDAIRQRALSSSSPSLSAATAISDRPETMPVGLDPPALGFTGRESLMPIETLAKEVADAYNASLQFPPDDRRMAYVVRDPLSGFMSQVRRPYGFANSIQIQCNSADFQLVFDGSRTVPLTYGSVLEFSIHPEDAVCCVQLSDS